MQPSIQLGIFKFVNAVSLMNLGIKTSKIEITEMYSIHRVIFFSLINEKCTLL